MDTGLNSIPRHARYLRCVEGADFSLEANTESVPERGHFYLLQAGQVLLRSDDFTRARGAYEELCHAYWESRLQSFDAGVRRRSALGLLGQDLTHQAAAAVLLRDGSLADQARVERARARHRAEERRAALRRPAAAPVVAPSSETSRSA